MKKIQSGFTILELLITIAIIGILTSILFVAINPSAQTQKAKVAKTVSEMKAVKHAVSMYVLDTLKFPPDCRLNCTAATDPFLTNVGNVPGWRGPYIKDGLWNRKHAWGGHLGVFRWDFTGDGKDELWLILDDDAPGTNSSDNSGQVPVEALQAINDAVDTDTDLNGGEFFRGNSNPFAEQEGAWRIYEIGQES